MKIVFVFREKKRPFYVGMCGEPRRCRDLAVMVSLYTVRLMFLTVLYFRTFAQTQET